MSANRTLRTCVFRRLALCTLLGSALSFGALSCAALASDDAPPRPPAMLHDASGENVVRVGVRREAEPFSYLKAIRAENRILPGYGGYIAEICRTVLRQMTSSGVFAGHRVKAVPVTAENRFAALAHHEVDLLCGPDSITTERLRRYNVSYPVFLSGIARVKLPLERMPRSTYCGPILGVVEGTTSEKAGIQAVTRTGLSERFDPAIKQYLTLKADDPAPAYDSALLTIWDRFVKRLPRDPNDARDASYRYPHGGRDDIAPGNVRTDECPNGFVAGPVVAYPSHEAGLRDLCRGRVLYYLGDVDIVKRHLAAGCEDIEISRQTFTREAYGIHFRKPPRVGYAQLSEAERRDAMLYSEFNHLLVLQMQSAERLLENQYREEFGDAEMAADLSRFFESLQFATDY